MNTKASTMVRDLFAGVNRPSDSLNLTDLERKHIPAIHVQGSVDKGEYFEVSVEVGKTLAHPNERGHFIEFIDLYADELFLARLDLTAINAAPKATFSVSLTGSAEELRAYARCNLHGIWLGSTPIAVH